ncbi:MAG: HemK2/MTQ2 family protein methyltransferase [Thermoplasmata archaeon]
MVVRLNPRLRVEEDDQVYRPAEDSYLLLRALDLAGASSFLEIGTGTGLIALHAAQRVRTVATDINPFAVSLTRANALRNDLSLDVVRADLLHGLSGTFDAIAFNPPYLPLKPRGEWLDRAWSGGRGGDEVVLRFLNEVPPFLAEGGAIYLLLSSQNREAMRAVQAAFDADDVGREALFFDEILVSRLRRRG